MTNELRIVEVMESKKKGKENKIRTRVETKTKWSRRDERGEGKGLRAEDGWRGKLETCEVVWKDEEGVGDRNGREMDGKMNGLD